MESNMMFWLKSLCNIVTTASSSDFASLNSTKCANHSAVGVVDNHIVKTNGEDNQMLMPTTSNDNVELTSTAAVIVCESVSTVPDANNNPVHNNSQDFNRKSKSSKGLNMKVQELNDDNAIKFNNKSSENIPNESASLLLTSSSASSVSCSPTPLCSVEPTKSCCDIIEYKNQIYRDLASIRLSKKKKNVELTSGQTFKSRKIIEAVIEAIKSRQLATRFDPYVINKNHSFQINPFMCVSITSCTIRGFSNVEKANNDGIVRYLGNNRFSIDCNVRMHNLVCAADYKVKFGGRWHKRPCLDNKTLTLTLDKCLIYVEVLINTDTKTIQFERFSPISQQQVRCKTKALAWLSMSRPLSYALQRYFERYFATNVVKMEEKTRKRLDQSELLNYDDIVTNTTLNKLFDCFDVKENNLKNGVSPQQRQKMTANGSPQSNGL